MNPATTDNRLMRAVRMASVPDVERALAAGANVDGCQVTPAIFQVPPICVASNLGLVDIIKVLIRRGADLEKAAGDGHGSEGEAVVCFYGGSNGVRLKRSRAVHAAIYGGKVEVLRVLLAAGANPNSTDSAGWTPLMVACAGDSCSRSYCEAEPRIEMLHALLDAGADPFLKTPIGGLAIHFAAHIGATGGIKVLLNRAPSMMNIMDKDGRTPLAVAAGEGQANTVLFLLSAGAREPAVWTLGGALYLAVQRNHQNLVRILLDQGLEAIGGVLDVPEAMCISIELGFIGILRLLLNVEGEERQKIWANHHVYYSTHQPVYVAFPVEITRGQANSIMAAKFGFPILHVAAMECSLRAAHVLLSVGADETAVDTVGKRAWDVVGDFQRADKKDAARKGGVRRMLQRGPAFRARSWAWTAKSDRAIGFPRGIGMSGADSIQGASIVRIYRGKRGGVFIRRYARYAVKGDLPFLRLPCLRNS